MDEHGEGLEVVEGAIARWLRAHPDTRTSRLPKRLTEQIDQALTQRGFELVRMYSPSA